VTSSTSPTSISCSTRSCSRGGASSSSRATTSTGRAACATRSSPDRGRHERRLPVLERDLPAGPPLDSPLGPARRVTCYKVATDDPLHATAPSLTSCPWRSSPIDEPGGSGRGPDVRPRGDAARRLARGQRRSLALRGHGPPRGGSPAQPRRPGVRHVLPGPRPDRDAAPCFEPGDAELHRSDDPAIHTATLYKAPSGATVFGAGTMQWSWALDSFGIRTWAGIRNAARQARRDHDRNLFNRLGDGPARQAG